MRFPSHRFDRPWRARSLVAALVLVEAVLLVAVAGWLVVSLVRGPADAAATLVLTALALGLAVVLAAAVRGLLRSGRGGRGLIITWQLLQGATAITLLGAPAARPVALGALALSVLVLGGLVAAGAPTGEAPVSPEHGSRPEPG